MRYTQPQSGPLRVAYENPITRGLQGLLWAGSNGVLDILNPLIPWIAGGSLSTTTSGIGRAATSAQNAANVPYSGNQAIQAPWKPAAPPLTLLTFMDPIGFGGATNSYAAVTSGGDGLRILNRFGANNRYVGVAGTGGTGSAALDLASLWNLGAHVRGLVHDGANLLCIDSGVSVATVASTLTAVTYDPSFTQVQLLLNTGGIGYWEALWNRALSVAELASLEANPWQLVAAPKRSLRGAAAAGATAVTMTGPASGPVSVASTAFTVGANGTITGTVIVTPSDSAGGGTFTPTTVSISSGTPTGTFTYTPASVGAKTISVTNNGTLTNPASITYTASAAGSRIFLPNWDMSGISGAGPFFGNRLS